MDELIRKQDVLNEIGEWIDASKDNRHEQSASDLRLVRNSIKEMPPANNRLIQIIEKGIKATGTADEYSVGMCNGMKWCKSLLDGKEPKYDTVQSNYKKAFSVACELLIGANLFGITEETMFAEIMEKDGIVSSLRYEKYILENLARLTGEGGEAE